MARHAFGGGIADYVVKKGDSGALELSPDTAVTFWDAPVDGDQHTGLIDATGTQIPDGVVRSDANGAIPAFGQGPEGVVAMWADASADAKGPRRLVFATDLGDDVKSLQSRVEALEAKLNGVGRLTVAPTAPAAPAVNDVWFDTSTPDEGNPVVFRSSAGATGNAASLTCPLPAGPLPGDYVLAVAVWNAPAGEALTVEPAGWTRLLEQRQFGGDTRIAVYGKVYAAGDAAPTWTFSATVKGSAGTVAYANADATVQVGPYEIRTGSGTDTNAPSINTAVPDALVVCLYGEKTAGVPTKVTDPAGTTRRLLQSATGTSQVSSLLVCDFAQPVPGATGVRTVSWTAPQPSDNGIGLQIALTRKQG
ncbi:hypothetical protein ACIBF1_14945 [Spirillospora sp. NPDC050679]